MTTTFTYRGIDNAGKPVHGELVADDAHNATALLKARAIFPTIVAPRAAAATSVAAGSGGRAKVGDLAILTRQLANLVAGGIPLMSAFAALTTHTESARLRVVLEAMQRDVHGGMTLWEALAAHPAVFPSLYVNMVKAGEASGQLAPVLTWLAEYQEKEQARQMQIRGALAYPTLLLIAGALAIILLITLVVPKFSTMFTEFGQALPLPTVILLGSAHFLVQWGWAFLVGAVLLIIGVRQYAKTPTGHVRVDGWRLRLPLFGKILLKSAMSRFARTTATLLNGGVPLLEALAVVRDVLDNELLAQATDRARDGMREGERLSARLQQTGVFPPFITHMIGIGEETGDLKSMLGTVASTYDIEVDTTLKGLISVLEPVIIISVGGIMGFIILSMLLPIFQIDVMGSG